VPARRRKRQRLGTPSRPANRLAAEHPDQLWALDDQFDQTQDGRRLKLLNIVDEHICEGLTIEVNRRIDADATVKVLDRLVTERGRPSRFLGCDNGPELTAGALRDWCRFSGAGTSYIEPGSPWQNPYVESFGGWLRDQLLAVEAFTTLLEARVLVEDWRIEDNTVGPTAPWLPDPDRLRPHLDHPTCTPITGGHQTSPVSRAGTAGGRPLGDRPDPRNQRASK
jgi:putative transposase